MDRHPDTANLVEQAFEYVENCLHSIMNTVRNCFEYYFNTQNN